MLYLIIFAIGFLLGVAYQSTTVTFETVKSDISHKKKKLYFEEVGAKVIAYDSQTNAFVKQGDSTSAVLNELSLEFPEVEFTVVEK
jgi:hypothetical protein